MNGSDAKPGEYLFYKIERDEPIGLFDALNEKWLGKLFPGAVEANQKIEMYQETIDRHCCPTVSFSTWRARRDEEHGRLQGGTSAKVARVCRFGESDRKPRRKLKAVPGRKEVNRG